MTTLSPRRTQMTVVERIRVDSSGFIRELRFFGTPEYSAGRAGPSEGCIDGI